MSITPEQAQAELERRAKGKHPIATPLVQASANFTGSFADNVDILFRKLVNLPLPEGITPEFASDKRIKELVKENEPLTEKPGGGFGKFAAEYAVGSAAAAPIGQGMGAALGAARNGPRLVQALGRYASGPFTRGALETAPVSALLAEPGERGSTVAKDALLGGLFSKTLSGAQKLTKGAAEYSDEARRLMQYARDNGEEIFVPLGAGAKDGPVREFYRSTVPALPGAKTKLQRQAEDAQEKVRSIMYNDTTPPNAPRIQNPGKDPQDTNRKLATHFKNGYDQALNSYQFTLSEDYFTGLRQQIDDLVDPQTADAIVEQSRKFFANRASAPFRPGDPIQVGGSTISNAKMAFATRARGTKEGNVAEAWAKARDSVDDIVHGQLSVQPTSNSPAQIQQARINQENLNLYDALNEKWGQFQVLKSATGKARAKRGGKWTADQALGSIRHGGEYGSGPLQGPLTDAQQTVGQNVYSPTAGGRLGAYAMMGIGGMGGFGAGGLGGAAAGLALGAGSGKALTTPGVQKFLLGELPRQKQAAELLRRYPKAAHLFDRQFRVGIAADGEE